MQDPQSFLTPEMMSLLMRRTGDKISAALGKLVSRSMRPGCFGFRHDGTVPADDFRVKLKLLACERKAAEARRTPKTLARVPTASEPREASWSAAALCRFGHGPLILPR